MYVPGLYRRPAFAPAADTNGGASAADTTETADTETADNPLDTTETDVAKDAADAQAASAADKDKAREGYEARKAKQEAEALRKELEGYKRREDDARKSKMSEDEKLKEERDSLAQEVARLNTEKMQARVAAEFKLPPALASRLIGTDEESMRADAEEMAKLLPQRRAGNAPDPARDGQGVPTYTREQLRKDPELARKVAVEYTQGKCKIV